MRTTTKSTPEQRLFMAIRSLIEQTESEYDTPGLKYEDDQMDIINSTLPEHEGTHYRVYHVSGISFDSCRRTLYGNDELPSGFSYTFNANWEDITAEAALDLILSPEQQAQPVEELKTVEQIACLLLQHQIPFHYTKRILEVKRNDKTQPFTATYYEHNGLLFACDEDHNGLSLPFLVQLINNPLKP